MLKEGAHEKSPKCLGGNLGDFGGFCKGLGLIKVSAQSHLKAMCLNLLKAANRLSAPAAA
ncbi:hypothetical protein [Neisseria meningitidis]|uniref:hypothetical protein n=1 Tax=Neisseria meningitidis TaxID=487 RepID=UPI0039F6D0D9